MSTRKGEERVVDEQRVEAKGTGVWIHPEGHGTYLINRRRPKSANRSKVWMAVSTWQWGRVIDGGGGGEGI